MKNTIIGFIILLFTLIIAWFTRDLMISTFVLPVILGLVQLGRLLNTIPQIVWWIFLTISAISLFFVNISLPEIKIRGRKKVEVNSGRIDSLNSLIKETINSSTYSGQQLSLLLVNMYLQDRGSDEISIHKLEEYVSREPIPDELKAFVESQFGDNSRQTNSAVIKMTLE